MHVRLPFLPFLPVALAALLGSASRRAPADDAGALPPGPPTPPAARAPERTRGGSPVEGSRPIDLAICLDTSGSMQGLIDAARRTIWSVVSELATAQPAPRLRVALLSYGSPGHDADGHVVVETDLTSDLDLVSERLFALGTAGGDEYVGRVVGRALDGLAWSAGDALRLLFVAGNESADQDRERPFRDAAGRAAKRGVRVNAIYCGGADDGDAGGWRELALLGTGRFASIDKDRGTVAVATPYDAELAALSRRLNATYVAYGRAAKESRARQEAQDANAAGAGAPAAAERAAAKASGLYANGTWDLVDRLAEEPALDLGALPEGDLPEELQKVPPAERRAWLATKRTERAALQEQVRALDQQRQAHVRAEMGRQRLSDDAGLDRALKEALREQAAAAGFRFEKAATPAPAPAPTSPPTPR